MAARTDEQPGNEEEPESAHRAARHHKHAGLAHHAFRLLADFLRRALNAESLAGTSAGRVRREDDSRVSLVADLAENRPSAG